MLSGHVIVAIFADEDSPLLGLRSTLDKISFNTSPLSWILISFLLPTFEILTKFKRWLHFISWGKQQVTLKLVLNNLIVNRDLNFYTFRNLLMPLRASNLSYNDLKHVVILGNLVFLKRYLNPWTLNKW